MPAVPLAQVAVHLRPEDNIAVAARNLGLETVPLLCAREIDVPNAMRSVIRVLLHYYAPADHTPTHAYLGEAQELRSDLKAAQ